jgi:hypothetical protein
MFKTLLTAGALLFAPMSVLAQECPGQTLTDVANLVADTGGEIIGIVEVDGQGFDRLVIARFEGQIVVGKFSGECVIGGPASVGKAAEASDA